MYNGKVKAQEFKFPSLDDVSSFIVRLEEFH